jgi:hypothetical protein
MIASGAPHLLANGTAAAPYMISLYVLAIGAGRESDGARCPYANI